MWQPGVDDFFLRACEIVFHPPLFDHRALDMINAIRRAPIGIAWLTDAAGINKIFFARIDPQLVDSLSLHAVVAHEGHRHMGVPEETNARVLISEARGSVEIVEDVAPLLG